MTTTASTNGVGGLELHDLSSQVRPRRRYEGAVPPPGDEVAEGHLRLILARKVADVLGQRPEAARLIAERHVMAETARLLRLRLELATE